MCSVVLTSCCVKGYLMFFKFEAVQNYLLFVKVPYFKSFCQDISMYHLLGAIIILRRYFLAILELNSPIRDFCPINKGICLINRDICPIKRDKCLCNLNLLRGDFFGISFLLN